MDTEAARGVPDLTWEYNCRTCRCSNRPADCSTCRYQGSKQGRKGSTSRCTRGLGIIIIIRNWQKGVRIIIRRGEEGVWDPKVCTKKGPTRLSPSHDGHFGLEGEGSRGGGGATPPFPVVHGHSNTALGLGIPGLRSHTSPSSRTGFCRTSCGRTGRGAAPTSASRDPRIEPSHAPCPPSSPARTAGWRTARRRGAPRRWTPRARGGAGRRRGAGRAPPASRPPARPTSAGRGGPNPAPWRGPGTRPGGPCPAPRPRDCPATRWSGRRHRGGTAANELAKSPRMAPQRRGMGAEEGGIGPTAALLFLPPVLCPFSRAAPNREVSAATHGRWGGGGRDALVDCCLKLAPPPPPTDP